MIQETVTQYTCSCGVTSLHKELIAHCEAKHVLEAKEALKIKKCKHDWKYQCHRGDPNIIKYCDICVPEGQPEDSDPEYSSDVYIPLEPFHYLRGNELKLVYEYVTKLLAKRKK